MLYIRKLMAEYAVEWELQLTVFGFLFLILAIIVSKMLSKVEFYE